MVDLPGAGGTGPQDPLCLIDDGMVSAGGGALARLPGARSLPGTCGNYSSIPDPEVGRVEWDADNIVITERYSNVIFNISVADNVCRLIFSARQLDRLWSE